MGQDLDEKSHMLGEHSARLDNLERSVAEIRDDVKSVLAHMQRAKGSWKTLVAIGGITTGAVELIHQLVDWFHSTGAHH